MIQQEMLKYQTLDIELNKIERELKKNRYFLKRKEVKAALQAGEDHRPEARGEDQRAPLSRRVRVEREVIE